MDGKQASKYQNSQGYVLDPYQRLCIPGWRLDDEKVANFLFAGAGGSYAEKTSGGENRGVIACAVWEERVYCVLTNTCNEMWYISTPEVYYNASPTTRTKSNPHGMTLDDIAGSTTTSVYCCTEIGEEKTVGAVQNLGTGFGLAASHAVREVKFPPASVEPCTVAVVYYDDRDGLRKRGIRIQTKYETVLPNPFPGDKGCKPPEGWQG
jgi:hypothetical protein